MTASPDPMTVPADRRASSRPRLVAVVEYTLRSCLPPKRWLGILLPCVGAVLFGLVTNVADASPARAFAAIAADGIFALALPIAALVIGDAVLGAEVRSGTFHFTWLSPTPLWLVVLGRWIGGSLVALVTIVPACALAAVVAGVPESAGPAAIAGGAGAIAYVAVFIAIGAIAKRAAIWSLAFVFLIERLLGTALTGIAQLSPTWESRAMFLEYSDNVPARLIRKGIPVGDAAAFRLAIISAVALALATRWLGRIRLEGASD